MNNKIPIIYWFALVAGLIATFFITKAIYGRQVIKEIHFEDGEKQTLLQQAYKNKIAADSLLALLKKAENNPPKPEIVKEIIRDTIRVPQFIVINNAVDKKDSVDVIEGKEEELLLPLKGKDFSGTASLAVKPRYFPAYSFFASDVKLKKLDMEIIQPEQSRIKIGIGIFSGIGIFTRKPDIMLGGGIIYDFKF